MYIRNDGKGESNITQNGFTAYLLSAVAHRKADYAKPANEGLFCVKDYCNHGHIGSYTLITPQGKLYFAQLRDMILMVV